MTEIASDLLAHIEVADVSRQSRLNRSELRAAGRFRVP